MNRAVVYALLVAVDAVLYFWLLQPAIDQAAGQLLQIAERWPR